MSKSARVLEWVTRGRVSLLKDSWRILTAALTALIVVYVLRLWAIGFGLGLVTFWDRWTLRLVTFWDAWALIYLGLTWLLLIRSSVQQTRQWALAQRIPPRPHLSTLRSAILRVLRAVSLVSRTSSLFFIVFVSLVSIVLAISLVPPTHSTTLTCTIDLKDRPDGLPFPARRVRTNWTSPTSPSRSVRALPSPM